MNRKKVIKTLKFCVIGLVLLTVVLFALSLFTLINGLMGAVAAGTFGLDMNKNEPPGDWVLKLSANPRNNGILGEKLFFSVGVRDANGEYIVVNSTSVSIAPGEQRPFSLTLTVPYEDVLKYNFNSTEGADVEFELLFGIRTLGDLVGFSQTMRIAGDATL